MPGLGLTELLIISAQLALFVAWVAGIVSAASFPDEVYRASRMNKVLIVVGVVVVPFGFIPYALLARPRLRGYQGVARRSATRG
jgi:hypothetical protein